MTTFPAKALGSPMDCVEDPSLFDLTKAMFDAEPNAEFSLCGDLSVLLAKCAPASFRVQGACM